MRRIAVLNGVMCETFLAGLEGYGSSLDASRPPGRLQKQDQRRMMLSTHDVCPHGSRTLVRSAFASIRRLTESSDALKIVEHSAEFRGGLAEPRSPSLQRAKAPIVEHSHCRAS